MDKNRHHGSGCIGRRGFGNMKNANDHLTDDPHINVSKMEVSVFSRRVALQESLNGRFEKRHVEDPAKSVSSTTQEQNTSQ